MKDDKKHCLLQAENTNAPLICDESQLTGETVDNISYQQYVEQEYLKYYRKPTAWLIAARRKNINIIIINGKD
jgi:hypothetical protein